MALRLNPDRLAGVVLVAALHAAALWGLWIHRLVPTPQESLTLFVNFVAPPVPPRAAEAPRREPPQARAKEVAPPAPAVAAVPASPPADAVVPAPPPAPAVVPAEPAQVTPVHLDTELAVSCPERTAPIFPLASRRMGETGITVLRVELDELGHVSAARVATSSGHARLDEAALAAVKSWRCNPALRNGRPVRAAATQAFKFLLQGN